jgi:hypothetical protein
MQSWIFLIVLCVVLAGLVLLPMLLIAWMAEHVLRAIGMDMHRLFAR